MTGCLCLAGILVSVKTRAQQKIHKLKESYDHLVQRVTQLQERTDKLVNYSAAFYLIELYFDCNIEVFSGAHPILAVRRPHTHSPWGSTKRPK